jgi:hypothetical protein
MNFLENLLFTKKFGGQMKFFQQLKYGCTSFKQYLNGATVGTAIENKTSFT